MMPTWLIVTVLIMVFPVSAAVLNQWWKSRELDKLSGR